MEFIFPEYLPEINDLNGDSNKIYVTTFREMNEKSEIIVLDLNGNIIKTCYVPKASLSNIQKGKFYYLVDKEEDEVWELHSVNL
ncbi:MAG: hypothetical protein KAS21_08875 [Candidatus Aminicenantes bacterium]|nr:hypothetical protein [Candidatus Aminicenantes bacterium]